jgi:transcription elongation factor Elf1
MTGSTSFEKKIRRQANVNAWKTIKLMEKYTVCPECGNEAIGNGEGTLEVTDDTFKRTCKCGWSIEVKE